MLYIQYFSVHVDCFEFVSSCPWISCWFYVCGGIKNCSLLLAQVNTEVIASNEKEVSSTTCPVCYKEFTTKSSVQYHMQRHTGRFSYWCELCQRGFPIYNRYKEHMDKHKGITYPCLSCDKRFKTKETLRFHQSTHTGVYRFKCQFCDFKFNKKSNLKSHETKCHWDRATFWERCQ